MIRDLAAFEEAVDRARRGDFREFWLQRYIFENFKQLGFSQISAPRPTGPDFRGVYDGRQVLIEAERLPRNFVDHKHDKDLIEILIVMGDDNTDRALLPKTIMVIDPEEFVERTHHMRQAFAEKRDAERKALHDTLTDQERQWARMVGEKASARKQKEAIDMMRDLPISRIAGALTTLWSLAGRVIPLEETPEDLEFRRAAKATAWQYSEHYAIDLDRMREGPIFTGIEVLANDLVKGKKDWSDLRSGERDMIEDWLASFEERLVG